MAGDGIEYYLKFPPPSEQPTLTNSSFVDDFVLVHNETKPPAVILLGWAGCQDKHLAKYGAIYTEKGCITLRCTAPLDCLLLRHDKMRALGRRLLDELFDLNLNEHPIFFHVFSNGGAYLYKSIALAMQEKAVPIKVLGTIWDSAPGERRLRSMYLALKAILDARLPPSMSPTVSSLCSALSAPLAFTLALVMTAWWLAQVLAHSLATLRPQPTDPLAALRDLPGQHTGAHLFLYSPTDKLVLAEDVERFACHRRSLGELVTAVRFEDSAHVQHYPTHRETYTEAIYSFVKDLLSGRRPSPT